MDVLEKKIDFLDPLTLIWWFIFRRNMMKPVLTVISMCVAHSLVKRIEALDYTWLEPFQRVASFMGEEILNGVSWIAHSALDRVANVVILVSVTQETRNILLMSLVFLSWFQSTNQKTFFRNFRKGILMVTLVLLWSYYWNERVSLFLVALILGAVMGFLLTWRVSKFTPKKKSKKRFFLNKVDFLLFFYLLYFITQLWQRERVYSLKTCLNLGLV